MATLKSIKNKYLQASDGDTLGVSDNSDNVALLAFKMQAADSIAKFNMVDGFSDSFVDATGIDTGGSTNEIRNAANYYSGSQVGGNYFGTGALGNVQFSDGSITQTSDTTAIDSVLTTGSEAGGTGTSSYGGNVPHNGKAFEFTVANKNGSYDGDMFVANFKDLTIDASIVLTTDQPCRGMFVFVDGDLVVNGALSMSSRGAKANPTASGGSDSNAVASNGLQFGVFTDSAGSSSFTNDGTGYNGAGTAVRTALANMTNLSSDGTVITISRTGGGGNYGAAGGAGTTGGFTLSTGGGGAGRATGPNSGSGNAGGVGGAFSSGSGRGGFWSNTGGGPGGGQGGNYGDAGQSGASGQTGGGAGNPAGSSGGSGASAGGAGNGGVLMLMVKGNITLGASGTIESDGTHGGSGAGNTSGGNGGGGTGGGVVMVLHGGTLTNNGAITVAGGVGGSGGSSNPGYAGGTGGTHNAALAPDVFNNLTLVSATQTAATTPTTGRIMIFEHASTGSATLNTDIKGWVSRDNGSNYDQVTLVSEGEYESGKRILSGSVDFTMSGSTNIRYKITTHNQAIDKVTRVHGASMLWS